VAIGPPIENGFYYDFDFPDPIREEDLPKIEAEIDRELAEGREWTREEISREEARRRFAEENEPYKLELVDTAEGDISLYTQGDFTDLCRGPHLQNSKPIKALKLTGLAGAYWRGDSNRPMLTRIYGTAFFSDKDLQDYLERLELAHQQRAGAGDRSVARDSVGARLGAVRRAESVHDEHLAERRHAARELLIVLLLAPEEAHVLAQHGAPRCAVDAVDPVLAQRHGLAEQLRQPRRDRRERERGILCALLRAAEVRHDEYPGVLIERVTDGGERGADARIARHHPIVHRHVQVFPDQDPLVAQVRVGHPQ